MKRFVWIMLCVALAASCSSGARGAVPTKHVALVMDLKASGRQIRAVEEQLENDPHVASFRFIDPNAAYSESIKLFSGQHHPTVSVHTSVAGPASFQVALRKSEDAPEFVQTFRTAAGVDAVNTARANAPTPSP